MRLRQARGENEEEYRHRLEAELERVAGGTRLIEQLRGLVRDVDNKMARCTSDYFAAPSYQQEEDCDDEDIFFLG